MSADLSGVLKSTPEVADSRVESIQLLSRCRFSRVEQTNQSGGWSVLSLKLERRTLTRANSAPLRQRFTRMRASTVDLRVSKRLHEFVVSFRQFSKSTLSRSNQVAQIQSPFLFSGTDQPSASASSRAFFRAAASACNALCLEAR